MVQVGIRRNQQPMGVESKGSSLRHEFSEILDMGCDFGSVPGHVGGLLAGVLGVALEAGGLHSQQGFDDDFAQDLETFDSLLLGPRGPEEFGI